MRWTECWNERGRSRGMASTPTSSMRGSLTTVRDDGAKRSLGCNAAKSKQPCCTRDEGRPLGPGLQDQGPNHHKLLRHNGQGVSVTEKAGITRQVCAGKTNASEPLMTCRKRWDVARNQAPVVGLGRSSEGA